jgi:hypothetical protein
MGSSTGASVAVSSAGALVGSAGAVVGSTAGGASVGVAPPHAVSTKLITMSTNINERTNLVISIFLLIFYTLSCYQAGFKGNGRNG